MVIILLPGSLYRENWWEEEGKKYPVQYLSKGIRQCHGKEEVCVGTPGMDPEVPEDRAESRGEEEHHQYHQSVAQVYM